MNAINFSRRYNTKYEDLNLADFGGQHPLLLIFTTGNSVIEFRLNFLVAKLNKGWKRF